jgi:hypothetical protein
MLQGRRGIHQVLALAKQLLQTLLQLPLLLALLSAAYQMM